MAYLQPYISSSAQGKLNLQGAEINFAWQNNSSEPDFPSKFASSDTIGAVDFLGWENPKVNVNGIFSGVTSPSFYNTLKNFAKSTAGDTIIYDPVYFTAGTQKIQINTLSFTRTAEEGVENTSSDTVKGSIVRYQLAATLTE
jgi:hypothetical protein